jgi:hypothetical protein
MRIIKGREYQKKKIMVEKYIRRSGKVDHSVILNEADIDYDTLMIILAELRKEGHIK